jgi:hypothetical protein
MTITTAVNNEIKNKGLNYSPKLFTQVKKELEKTFVNTTKHSVVFKDSKLSFINSNLSTDLRLK